jgi:hypothetical protein
MSQIEETVASAGVEGIGSTSTTADSANEKSGKDDVMLPSRLSRMRQMSLHPLLLSHILSAYCFH